METIKGKPELVCNTHPALLLQPPQLCRTVGTRSEGKQAPIPTGGFCKPCCLQSALLLGEGTAAQPGPGGAAQPLWEREGGRPAPRQLAI